MYSSIWGIERSLSSASTPNQSGPGSDGYEGVSHILQNSNITGFLPLDCLVSYTGHSFGRFFPPLRDTVVVFCSPLFAKWAKVGSAQELKKK